MHLQTQKCWQGPGPGIVWQTQIRQETGGRLKGFLSFQVRGGASCLNFSLQKPSDVTAKASFIDILKKRCGKTQRIEGVLVDTSFITKTLGDSYNFKDHLSAVQLQTIFSDAPTIIISLRCFGSSSDSEEAAGEIFYLSHNRRKGAPNEISLLDSHETDWVRMSTQGFYTKRKSCTDPLASATMLDLLPSFVHNILSSSDPKTSEQEESTTEPLSHQKVPEDQLILARKLSRRLKTIRKSRIKLEEHLPSCADVEKAQTHALLLQQHAYLGSDYEGSVTISSELAGSDTDQIILLNDEKTIGDNITALFRRAKKLEKARTLESKRLVPLQEQEQLMANSIELLRAGPVSEDQKSHFLAWLPANQRDLSTRPQTSNPGAQKPSPSKISSSLYRSFIGADDSRILVGKGPKENDQLTKAAKSSDDWFHVQNVPGSHVVVPYKNNRIETQKKLLFRQAAILALHFSKIRQDQAGEVTFTKRAHLKKRKGMPPGRWLVERSQSLYVRYEEKELRELLDTMVS